MRQQARLQSIGAHLAPPHPTAAAAAPFVGNSAQGLGIRAAIQPPVFDPKTQHDEAFEFWQEHGFVVVAALSEQEVAEMNAAADEGWLKHYAHQENELMVFYPLMDYPAVDKFCNHENTMPLISQMLGGWEHTRFQEFNWRWYPDDYGAPSAEQVPQAISSNGMHSF